MGLLKNRSGSVFIILFLTWGSISATDKNQSRIKYSIQKDMDIVSSIIEDNVDKVNSLGGEITHLEYQVAAAYRIIKLVDNQGKASSNELNRLDQQLQVLSKEKKEAQLQLQSLLIEEYKNRDYKKKLFFLASSKNINEFIQRLKSLGTLKDFRLKQLRVLENKEQEVREKLSVYRGSSLEKKEISAKKQEYIGKLNELLRKKHQAYKEVEKENQTLQIRLQEKEEMLDKLDKQITNSIASGTGKTGKNSGEFRLSWPVKKGLLVSKFGVHKHAKERKVKIVNNGIDVLVSANEGILAAKGGLVKAVLNLPGLNTSIILDHGEYFTVYSNVKDVAIEVGEKVEEGQQVAAVALDAENAHKLHFEVWHGVRKENPELFLEGEL